MRKHKLSLIALALAVCGTANAGLVGNKAMVDAPITVSATNNTSVTWTAESIGTDGFSDEQKLGTLNITATGAHSAINIAGDDAKRDSGMVVLPFKDDKGVPQFYARIMSAIDLGNSGIDGLPGWKVTSTEENVSVDVNAYGDKTSLTPGVYSAKFYVQQWQD
ncbi:CD15/CS22/SEF14 family fimbrial major subunit [Salmonella enterica]|uniref:CD15/CS22/SEF14 family fimbrial major subunit n=1 Tax=Salmonella enterica TaxID=28901 RepID=UPI0015C67A96|nr:CD15/CS22/SEF14 family fimbrial major subunit [Salmonella enterica]EIU5772578.1 CD15/CS22/SEF14 family fimbrial major subunit [Salmonella enterica]NYA57911.1 CD15/CS22/SEF14 family fimbrial major subunit [Salmonella enterica]